MKVKYYTKQIDKILYGQIIYKFIAENIENNTYNNKLKEWRINIYPVTMFESIYPHGVEHYSGIGGQFSGGMPHGVTGKNKVDVFIKDSKDYGLTVLQNTSVITHELSHMLLMIKFNANPNFFKRAPLRHDDRSGNKAGQQLNKWTQEVHDREHEGNLKNMTVYRRIGIRWYPYTVRVLNLEGFPY